MRGIDISAVGWAAARASAMVGARGLRAGLLSALLAASVLAQADEPSPLAAYAGRLIDIGGHALHLDCRGHGSPVVVLESGIGGFSLEWRTVQTALAKRMRVCAYDRAGYGKTGRAAGWRHEPVRRCARTGYCRTARAVSTQRVQTACPSVNDSPSSVR